MADDGKNLTANPTLARALPDIPKPIETGDSAEYQSARLDPAGGHIWEIGFVFPISLSGKVGLSGSF